MFIKNLVEAMEEIAPTRFAESWDNVGLLVGDPMAPLKRILLCIDYTSEVAREAYSASVDAVLAYHPPVFKPMAKMLAGNLAFDAIRAGIALYSPHTALDVAEGGTNDVLARVAGVTHAVALKPIKATAQELAPPPGMGRVGNVEPIACDDLIAKIKSGLNLSGVLVAGPIDRQILRVAVGAGSCGDLLDDAIAANADLYLTGELSHHRALRAQSRGITVVCVMHSNSERATLSDLKQRLATKLPGVDLVLSAVDRDPFFVH